MVRIIKKVGFFLSDCQRWKKPTFGSFLALYGAKVGFHRSRPKVGFHFWKVGFSPLVGFRTAKGGLPCLEGGLFVSLAKGGLKRPNLGFSSGRWAFPCLTAKGRLRRSSRLRRWAFLLWWASMPEAYLWKSIFAP